MLAGLSSAWLSAAVAADISADRAAGLAAHLPFRQRRTLLRVVPLRAVGGDCWGFDPPRPKRFRARADTYPFAAEPTGPKGAQCTLEELRRLLEVLVLVAEGPIAECFGFDRKEKKKKSTSQEYIMSRD
jgi:hypothetical protein